MIDNTDREDNELYEEYLNDPTHEEALSHSESPKNTDSNTEKNNAYKELLAYIEQTELIDKKIRSLEETISLSKDIASKRLRNNGIENNDPFTIGLVQILTEMVYTINTDLYKNTKDLNKHAVVEIARQAQLIKEYVDKLSSVETSIKSFDKVFENFEMLAKNASENSVEAIQRSFENLKTSLNEKKEKITKIFYTIEDELRSLDLKMRKRISWRLFNRWFVRFFAGISVGCIIGFLIGVLTSNSISYIYASENRNTVKTINDFVESQNNKIITTRNPKGKNQEFEVIKINDVDVINDEKVYVKPNKMYYDERSETLVIVKRQVR